MKNLTYSKLHNCRKQWKPFIEVWEQIENSVNHDFYKKNIDHIETFSFQELNDKVNSLLKMYVSDLIESLERTPDYENFIQQKYLKLRSDFLRDENSNNYSATIWDNEVKWESVCMLGIPRETISGKIENQKIHLQETLCLFH